jgi:hypothetical protein
MKIVTFHIRYNGVPNNPPHIYDFKEVDLYNLYNIM